MLKSLTVRSNVAVLSHPFRSIVAYVYSPEEEYVVPFHAKSSHDTSEVEELVIEFTKSIVVTVLSHPNSFVKASVYVPEDVYTDEPTVTLPPSQIAKS